MQIHFPVIKQHYVTPAGLDPRHDVPRTGSMALQVMANDNHNDNDNDNHNDDDDDNEDDNS